MARRRQSRTRQRREPARPVPPLPIPPALAGLASAFAGLASALRELVGASAIHAAGNAILAWSRLVRMYLNPRTSSRQRAQIRDELAALRMWGWPDGPSTPALRAKRARAIERALADAKRWGRVRVDGRWRWGVPAKLLSDTDLALWCQLRTWRYLTAHVRRRPQTGQRIKPRSPAGPRGGSQPAVLRSLGT
jgi:hypothetical protein